MKSILFYLKIKKRYSPLPLVHGTGLEVFHDTSAYRKKRLMRLHTAMFLSNLLRVY